MKLGADERKVPLPVESSEADLTHVRSQVCPTRERDSIAIIFANIRSLKRHPRLQPSNFDHASCSTSASLGKRHTLSRRPRMLAVLRFSLISRCTHRAHAAFQLIEKLELSFQSIIGPFAAD